MSVKKTQTMQPEQGMDRVEEVFLPIISGEDRSVWLGLNGRSWQIPRGRRVIVAAPVAERLHRSAEAGEAARAYSEAESRKGETSIG